jgi:RNase P subunit RPR2
MRFYCSGCQHILWENISTIEPVKVIKNLNGKCPNCQKELVYNLDLVRLSPVLEAAKT